ncbi:protein-disulfide reductase DsbD family protein [Alphaproteobacteria bacterium]|nr:protein-disulfide reductase DsbD family protein [Alphaproteobacteria bacterium]
MKFKHIYILFIYFFSVEVLSIESKSYNYEGNEVKLLLIKKNQSTLDLGLDFNLGKGWKIYWKYPGDSGSPPKISLLDSDIVDHISIKWPFPKELYEKEVDITTRVYEDQVILPIQVILKNIKKDKLEKIKLKIEFQICKELCIPLSTVLKIDLPESNFHSKKNSGIIKEFEKLVPKKIKLPDTKLAKLVTLNNKYLIISINKNLVNINKEKIYKVKAFFHNEKVSTLRFERHEENKEKINIIFSSEESLNATALKSSQSLVFVKINQRPYYWKQNYEVLTKAKTKNSALKLLSIISISFLGGIILNFMPCVLPVLGLKISSFLQQLELKDKRKIKISCLSLVLGIIFTFLLFGVFATTLRVLGKSVGWGMQFQNPIFLSVIIIILIIFIMNLLGVFNIRVPLYISNLFSKNMNNNDKNIYLKNFFIGMFSTILATPCTAPFVGSAVSIALTQNYLMTFLIFFIMAIGKSSPYIIFIFYPRIINFLPKPGKWLNKIKYFFAFLLFITLLWALNILLNNSNTNNKNYNSSWEEFNSTKLEEYINNNKILLVDVTAKWCITCAINKKLVLENKDIIKLLDKYNVKKIRADWTLKDESILLYLNKYDKYGIPFNILYSKEFPEGYIFNEILTKKQFQSVFKKITIQ